MSRTRIVKGNYTKISAKGHSMYSRENIISSANKEVRENGVEKGAFLGSPQSPPQQKGKIFDIVMFVAETTDPINKLGLQHEANTDYWRAIDEKTHKKTKASATNFWHKIKDLKYQYLNLHIEGDFFSWSGDNDTMERNLAAERLLDLILRVYHLKNQEVHLHLIGHSYGGNVINQFTELITSKEMISKSKVLKSHGFTEFPKLWKVKSHLSVHTFFPKKASVKSR